MKDAFAKSGTFCIPCRKNGLGPISLKVVKFDWESEAKSERRETDEHAPIKLDPTELSPDQIKANMEREIKLQKEDRIKNGG